MGISRTNNDTIKLDKIDRKVVGFKLKKVRKENNLTQEQLASLLNTSHSTISAYESGKTLIIATSKPEEYTLKILEHFDSS